MITKLKYGNTNTFLVHGSRGSLLIDTDFAGTLPLFFRELGKNSLKISDISYVIATHYHPDHMGLVSELTELGVKLLLADTQYEYVHFSDEIFGKAKMDYAPVNESEAVVISCPESRKFLQGLGINGEIISTPSHSGDSISVILDIGECFVGDLEPMEFLEAYEENIPLKNDWELIKSYAPKTVYYGHANEKNMR
ncbi:MAG: MBL fold metallo-hydrolase [Oscillospiraceae bacterium]|nr:MBL fold metallo-hydrolase [Oscillospiraceae bacterium]